VTSVWLNTGLVVLLVIFGGFFAAAEIALVSLRDSQIRNLAQRGKRGETVARVAEDPNRFLSAVQVGVTLMGFLSAAFGGATLANQLAPVFVGWGISAAVADVLALVLVTLVIAYVSIVLGELVAKRLALQRAEGTALLLAPAIDRIATALLPFIWLLGRSTDVVLRLLGGDPGAQREQMSDQELRELVSSHGTLTPEERQIVEEVFEAVDRQIREVMIPRTEVDFIDASMPVAHAAALATERPHSRYPVIRGSSDDVIGFLHVRDLFQTGGSQSSLRVGDLVRDTLMLPGTREVLPALADMRREKVHLAIVVDEYGGTAGIVTMEDLLEELIGDIRDEFDEHHSQTQRLVSGEVEVDGLLNLEDFADETGLELPEGPYETVAGYITSCLGRLPAPGDECAVDGHLLAVVAMDGRRIERVRVRAETADSSESTSG